MHDITTVRIPTLPEGERERKRERERRR